MGGLRDEDRLFPWRRKAMTDRTTWVVICPPPPPHKGNKQSNTNKKITSPA